MRAKIMFNTLEYAKILDKGGVDKSEVYVKALEKALSSNLYTTSEVDEMYNKLVARIDSFQANVNNRFDIMDTKLEATATKLELERITNTVVNRVTINVGIISAMLAIVAAVMHYIH